MHAKPALLATILALSLAPHAAAAPTAPACKRVVIEGEVHAGQSFEKAFSPGLKFIFEAIPSGWIVRVVDATRPRSAHDFAELASPPFRSVTPLAVSTDFSFRAQDAAAWNPRRFHFAANSHVFAELQALYDPAMAGDSAAAARLAALAAAQPAAELTILDAHFAPGTNDQAAMAATVASHLERTPHTVETQGGSPLGRLTSLRFRVAFTLPAGLAAAPGVSQVESTPCAVSYAEPTHSASPASQGLTRPRRNVRK